MLAAALSRGWASPGAAPAASGGFSLRMHEVSRALLACLLGHLDLGAPLAGCLGEWVDDLFDLEVDPARVDITQDACRDYTSQRLAAGWMIRKRNTETGEIG